jgi:hypothetical protein
VSKLEKCNPNSFWKNVRTQYRQPTTEKSNISIDDMYIHFNSLHRSTV